MSEQTSKESYLTFTEVAEWKNWQLGGGYGETIRTPQYRPYRNWAEGIKNPKWRMQVILLQNATTPFEGYSYKIVSVPYFTETTCYPNPGSSPYAPIKHTQYGNQAFIAPAYTDGYISGVPTDAANTAALGALVEDIRKKHTAFQGSTFIAELTKTIRQLRNPAKDLRKGVFAYLSTIKRNGRRWTKAGRKAALDALTGTYLEYTYGWTPLINDIDSIKTAIAEEYKANSIEPIWAHGVGEDMGLIGKDKNYTSNYITSVGAPRVARRQRYYARVKYSSLLGYNITGGQTRNLGFQPREWLPALLEVIPWSFVAAYFTNIDEIVTGLSYVGSNVRFTNKTTTQVWHQDYPAEGGFDSRPKYPFESQAPTTTGSTGLALLEGKRVLRAKYYGSLIPPPAFHLPGSGRKWLNLAALAVANREAIKALKKP